MTHTVDYINRSQLFASVTSNMHQFMVFVLLLVNSVAMQTTFITVVCIGLNVITGQCGIMLSHKLFKYKRL